MDWHLADPGQNFAFRQKTVPHQPLATLVVQRVDVTCQELWDLSAHRSGQKLLGSCAQHIW